MEKKIIEDYYLEKIINNNEPYKIHGWESDEAQKKRLNVLIDSVNLNKKSLLDVGCGVGSLYNLINEKNIKCDYLGVDILPEMIEKAKKFNPNGTFMQMDLLNSNPFDENCFDIIFSSGIFNLQYGNNEGMITEFLQIFNSIAQEYIVINFLNKKSKNKEDKYFYTDQISLEYIIKKSRIKFKDIKFIDDYLENDITLVIKK